VTQPTVAEVGSVHSRGYDLVYEVHGSGPRTFVFTHGVLFDAAMERGLARRLAARGNRVVLFELLGHGRSAKPTHAYEYRLEFHVEDTLALLDHLGIEQTVLGGTSLGANVALQLTVDHPERVRALVLEMPVMERGAIAAAAQFWPLLVALRYGWPVLRPVMASLGAIPRTGQDGIDALLDLVSGDPRVMAAVLHGLFVGPTCPSARERRRIDRPALVIGHRGDLLHPMSDASALARELPDARLVRAWSMIEARTFPDRIAAAIGEFLDEQWGPRLAPVVGLQDA
jgi:pimeloyl-ACP methyl ester carboxylesterase